MSRPRSAVRHAGSKCGRLKSKRDLVELVMKREHDKVAALELALADARPA